MNILIKQVMMRILHKMSQTHIRNTHTCIMNTSTKGKKWQTHKRAGKLYEETQNNDIDKQVSFQWIKNGKLKFDEERLLIAAQDQGLMTNGFLKMCGLRQDDKCRFCHTATESTYPPFGIREPDSTR